MVPRFLSSLKGCARVATGIILVLFFCQLGFAQGGSGVIQGSVTDTTGASIPGATVTIRDVARGITRTLTTDQGGAYVAPNLLPSTYSIRVTARGFRTIERSGVTLEVGQNLRIDFPMQVGRQAQTVVVTGQVPLVQVTTATLGGTFSNNTINNLPLMGRNYKNLASLRPGSAWYPGGGGWTQSSNGSRPEEAGYIVDGLTNQSPLTSLGVINGAGADGDAITLLPMDAIQEFHIVENPPAEYGFYPGAIINVGLKSGTNQIHGTAYAFGRSDSFDARNYFDTAPVNGTCNQQGPQPLIACNKSPVELEQWGATIGGPIKKNKLFYFLGFEEERYSIGDLIPDSVPEANSQATTLNPTGDPSNSFPDAISALQANGITPAALSLHLAGCTLGPPITCNGGLFGNNTSSSSSFTNTYSTKVNTDNGLARIDYHVNDKNTINGFLFIARALVTAPDFGQPFSQLNSAWLTQQPNQPQVFDGNWVWTPNSRWVNDFRFGYTWFQRKNTYLDASVPATHYGINTGVTNPLVLGFPNILLGGFTSLGGFPGWPIYAGPLNMFEGTDSVDFLHGKHDIKFGVDIHYNRNGFGRLSQGKGFFLFGGGNNLSGNSTPLEDFLAGTPTFGRLLGGVKLLTLSNWWYATFVEDSWRVTPRLTLNLGLRWDYETPLKESQNRLANFNLNAAPGVFPIEQVGHQISTPYNAQLNNFAPRIGVAWDITGKGTTVLHAGYTIVYNNGMPMFEWVGNAFGNNANTLGLEANPAAATIVVNGVATRPCPSCTVSYGNVVTGGPTLNAAWQSQPGDGTGTPLFANAGSVVCGDGVGSDPGPCSISPVARNWLTPYNATWNFGIEHAFTNNLSLNVAYVGNHGSRLPSVTDINQINPSSFGESGLPGSTCYNLGQGPHCEATADRPYGTQYPWLQFINYISNLYSSNYNSLQVTATQRLAHGLSFLAGYTYSHALGYAWSNIDEPLPQNSYNPYAEYSNSQFDVRHHFTLALTYNLPGVNGFGQILKGWQVNSIITIQSGLPWGAFTSTGSVDYSGTGEYMDRWDFFGNNSDFTSTNHTIPFCGAASPTVTADFSTGSNITCTEVLPGGTETLGASQTSAFVARCYTAAAGISADTVTSLNTNGCYAQGSSVMIPPAFGSFGTMARNPFRDSGLRDVDFSVTKTFRIKERLSTEFRAEVFNIFNHPNFTNPYGASNGFGHNDPGNPSQFGCGCETPDVAAGNPVLGAGGNRAMQLGLKLIW